MNLQTSGKLKKTASIIMTLAMFASCSSKASSQQNGDFMQNRNNNPMMQESSGVQSIQIQDTVKYLVEDCVENYTPEATVSINFTGKTAESAGISATEKGATVYTDSQGKKVTLYLQPETEDEAQGIIIEYKGSECIKYSLSGSLEGTLKIKNKNAVCIVELNGVSITSSASGPALHLTSEEYRTFIIAKEGTVNNFTDTRVLGQDSAMVNDKKGSVYAKGAVIFSGNTSTAKAGTINITNTGYKHGLYSHDYVRIQNGTLNINCEGTTSRDCIRTLNGVIIDNGNINLLSNGTIYDDEGCGIKVEGEDADEDKLTVEYTAGTGFIVINGGTINSTTSSKGITAHWKQDESFIEAEGYQVTSGTSLLAGTSAVNSDAEKPEPYVVINGGSINITTTLTPYENSTASCSPEGIEAKADLIINGGNLTLCTTDDSLNAGAAIVINDGFLHITSTMNDALDANGPSGITVNGGVIFASAVSTPECAFDCDFNPFTVNGGTLIGFGSSNITSPSSNSLQKTIVLGTSGYSGKNLAIKQNGSTVFACQIPQNCGESIIISSPLIQEGKYEIYSGSNISGTSMNELYYNSINAQGGSKTESGSISETVTMIGFTGGFGGPGGMNRGDFGGQGFRGNEDFGRTPPQGFDGNLPQGFGEMPPEGFGGTPPEGFDGRNPWENNGNDTRGKNR